MMKIIIPTLSLMLLNYFNKSWWLISMSLLFLVFISLMNTMPLSILSSITPMLMMDLMSASLMTLSILIAALMMLSSSKIYMELNSFKLFSMMNISLLTVLILCFSSSSLITFYIWFEASLIPTMMIIMMWGYQPERIQASMYLMLYTVTASLPMLTMFLMLYNNMNHLSMFLTSYWELPSFLMSNVFWLILILGFLVKLPMYLTHLWLPKAHVEAPIAGSMVLAAILLKLGGYGLLRVSNMLIKFSNMQVTSLIMSISLCGAVMTSLICVRQPDLKSLIAYSSVGHMGLLIAAAMTNTAWAMWGSLMIMVAHGFCSSALFILANLNYELVHTRSMYLIKGVMTTAPTLTFWWFLFSIWNMAAPPSINLMSEIMLLTSIISSSMINAILIMLVSFLAAVYSLNMYASTQHGHISSFTNPLNQMKQKDMFILYMHLIPILLLILKPEIISMWTW